MYPKLKTFSVSLCATLLVAMALFSSGCGEDGTNGLVTLMVTSDSPPGAICANGGTEIDVGVDQNENGVLDDSEVESTTLVCNGSDGEIGDDGDDGANGTNGVNGTDGDDGANGVNTLTRMTILDDYDEDCPYGGLQIDSGADTDGDGVLDDDEIEVTEYVCNGEPGFFPEDVTAPEGPVGAFTINLTGGVGSTAREGSGTGGQGGNFGAELDYGSLGGHIKVFDTGIADASFDFPTSIPTFLGSNPLEVADDLTIVAIDSDSHDDLGGAVYHTHFGESVLWERDGSVDVRVTGVSVAAGRTLTFEVNQRLGEVSEENIAVISLENDFRNGGTLTVEEVDPETGPNFTGALSIECDIFVGEAGSAIDLEGSDAAAGVNGSHGGRLRIDAQDDDWWSTQNPGAIFNQGTITTSGGAGDSGGEAGVVELNASLAIYNTGDITATGGAGTDGSGGSGPDWDKLGVYFATNYGNNFNSGDIDASGGPGTTSGGDGGDIYFFIRHPGDVLNSGDLTARGGAATDLACVSNCDGGSGGSIDFDVDGGGIINSGDLIIIGGASVDAVGGAGGYVFAQNQFDDGWYGEYQPNRSIVFSGNIDTAGGDGASGGSAGWVDFEINADYVPDNQEIILLGYTDIITSGGNGATDGGDAGNVEFSHEYSYEYEYSELPSGGIVNYAAITAMGGVGADGSGGAGACIELLTEDDYGYASDAEIVLNYGALATTGGDGTTEGGDGGCVTLWGYNRVENAADIDVSGGDASAVDGEAGTAGFGGERDDGVQLISDLGPVINTGDITAVGGTATGQSGDGGYGEVIEIVGYSVVNSGDLSVAGGDGGTTGVDASGGDASIVFLYGIFEGTENTATSIDLNGGEGNSNDGDNGECFIDGLNYTASWL